MQGCMSAKGHKWTCALRKGMSAFPTIADMCAATRYVRFVPIADIGEVRGTRFDRSGRCKNECLLCTKSNHKVVDVRQLRA
jgi:hypothetical protein